ncbi:threonine synthase [Haloarculaceae archaeon H-GB2-1]|nr:threonine synthase [Haloarculaceae archaeon H-GB1-1]MEA5408883.1 threonine synthase [Haloarculaceae archaeon H-GB2-1]
MDSVVALACTRCGRRHDPDSVTYTCPEHDGVTGILDVVYDYEGLADRLPDSLPDGVADMWDFAPLLPVGDGPVVSMGEGGTPLLDAPTLSEALGVATLVKDETGNPTGSTKDRGSSVVVTRARQEGRDVVTCASTGNAAASLAGYAARGDLDCRIFVPANVPEGKAVQPLVYGADVLAVDGDYDDAYDLCRTVARRRDWYNRSAAMNPYAMEGKRTLGHELALQGGDDLDWVVLPVGNGCTLAGTWKGLREFERLGLLDDAPAMLGVQAAGSSAVHDRFHDREPSPGETTADSIDVGTPHNAGKACDALVESEGTSVTVTDDAILDAAKTLGGTEGIYAEPASAATVAGVREALERGIVDPSDAVAVVATGTGFKDVASARRRIDDVESVPADPASVPEF